MGPPTRRVYDLLLFNQELELLETRLSYLDPVVDVFVIGESEQTFIGEAKPLWFAQNRARFQKYEKKSAMSSFRRRHRRIMK